MSSRTPTDVELLAAAARLGGLELSPERLSELVPAMDSFYAMLDPLSRADQRETPPAFAFRADWEGR